MKLIGKSILSIMFSLILIFCFNNDIIAQEIDDKEQIDYVKESVQQQFENNKPALEIDKKNFGLSTLESFSNATLGDGYAYWVISTDCLDNKQTQAPFGFAGYLFTIKVGDKTAGILKVQDIDGRSTITEMSSYNDFDKDLINAKKNINKNATTKFIYDENFYISGLATTNGSTYDFIPTQNNSSLGLVKNEMKPFADIYVTIQQEYQDSKANSDKLRGMNGNITSKGYLSYFIFGLAILAVLSGTIFFGRSSQR